MEAAAVEAGDIAFKKMKKLLATYKEKPLAMAGHAWLVLFFSLFLTYGFLSYAQKLYNGEYQLAGLLLHRSFIVMFLLAALMAVLSFLTQLYRQITARDLSLLRRTGNIVKGFLAAAPVALLGGVAALFLLIGKYMGLALG